MTLVELIGSESESDENLLNFFLLTGMLAKCGQDGNRYNTILIELSNTEPKPTQNT